MTHLIAIPAYNVAATIGDVLRDLADQRGHVLVVDDGSTDGTGELVRSLGFRTVRHRRTRGVGRALKTAIDYASGEGHDVVVTLDADGQHPPLLVKTFLAELHGRSLVLGNRFSNGLEQVHDAKLAANLAAALTINTIFGVHLSDVACGYRAFRCQDWVRNLPSDGYGFLYEQLIHHLADPDEIATVEIEPVFAPSVLWATRAVEVEGFLAAVLRGRRSADPAATAQVKKAVEAVDRRADFEFEMSGHTFHCLHLKSHDAYLVQTDVKKARRTMAELAAGLP